MSSPTIMQVLHQGGGAGSVTSTLHLSLGLARAGWDVRFVCPPDSEVEALARERGLTRLSLETGTPEAFRPARSLYSRHGFVECGPFGDYAPSPYSTFLTRDLGGRP